MAKIIIGIHGLGNKPPPKTLSRWWQAAIREGLERLKKPNQQFAFELVYWAHYLYPLPLKPRIKDNDYEYGDIKNPHKSYGYLRTLEMAEIIDDFLNHKEG